MAVFQIHDKDNVAVAVDRVAKGDTVLVRGQQIVAQNGHKSDS